MKLESLRPSTTDTVKIETVKLLSVTNSMTSTISSMEKGKIENCVVSDMIQL
jgi:hypothetical protein